MRLQDCISISGNGDDSLGGGGLLGLLSSSKLDLGGDAIQVTTALACQPPATVGVLLCQLKALKSLESLPGDTSSSSSPVGGAGAIVAADTIDLLHCRHTNGRPDVHVAGHGRSTDIEPIFVIGGKLLPVVGLHKVNPLWHLHLARPLEEGCKGHGELLLADILN